MSKTSILQLIPESLHEQLFAEVKEALISKGVKIEDPVQEKKKTDSVDKEIEAWSKNKNGNTY